MSLIQKALEKTNRVPEVRAIPKIQTAPPQTQPQARVQIQTQTRVQAQTETAEPIQTQTEPETPRPWEYDPTGDVLEQELTEVQQQYEEQQYVERPNFSWKTAGNILLAISIVGFSLMIFYSIRAIPAKSSISATPAIPAKAAVPVSRVVSQAQFVEEPVIAKAPLAKVATVVLPERKAVSGSEAAHSAMLIFSDNVCRLTGITSFGLKSMAVINGKLVGVGDPITWNAVVKEIKEGEVILDVQGKEIKLSL